MVIALPEIMGDPMPFDLWTAGAYLASKAGIATGWEVATDEARVRARSDIVRAIERIVAAIIPLIQRKSARSVVLAAAHASVPTGLFSECQVTEICKRTAFWLKFGTNPTEHALTFIQPTGEDDPPN
jgi:hypothetical protein